MEEKRNHRFHDARQAWRVGRDKIRPEILYINPVGTQSHPAKLDQQPEANPAGVR
jgi:hypothetical protein